MVLTATAGTPGSFSGGPVAADFDALGAATASPTTAWTPGQRIGLADHTEAHWNGAAWVNDRVPGTPTAGLAGLPGELLPAHSQVPANLAELISWVPTAIPATKWIDGEHIILADGNDAYWDGGKWAAGDAPNVPGGAAASVTHMKSGPPVEPLTLPQKWWMRPGNPATAAPGSENLSTISNIAGWLPTDPTRFWVGLEQTIHGDRWLSGGYAIHGGWWQEPDRHKAYGSQVPDTVRLVPSSANQWWRLALGRASDPPEMFCGSGIRSLADLQSITPPATNHGQERWDSTNPNPDLKNGMVYVGLIGYAWDGAKWVIGNTIQGVAVPPGTKHLDIDLNGMFYYASGASGQAGHVGNRVIAPADWADLLNYTPSYWNEHHPGIYGVLQDGTVVTFTSHDGWITNAIQSTTTNRANPIPAPPPPAPTSATEGVPGHFAPHGVGRPANLGAMTGVTAVPNTAWTGEGAHVVLGDTSKAYWDGAKWTAGTVPSTLGEIQNFAVAVAATTGGNTLTLTWDRLTDATTYEIELLDKNHRPKTPRFRRVVNDPTHRLVLTDVPLGVHDLVIQAKGASGASPMELEDITVPPPTTQLPATASVSLTGGVGQATVTWQTVAAARGLTLAAWDIVLTPVAGGTPITFHEANPATLTHTFTAVPAGDYTASVQARDQWAVQGTAGTSSQATVTAPAPVATDPTGATAGSPGSFTPPGSTVPPDLAALRLLGNLGQTTPWTTGQSIALGTGTAYWDGAAWQSGLVPATLVAPTGVTPGAPGSYQPAGATIPANLAALQALGPLGQTVGTPWTTGQYVGIGNGAAYWDGTQWQPGSAPAPPVPPTGVVPGDLGAFVPPGSALPADLTALQGLGTLGQTARWPEGFGVLLGDGSVSWWDGAAWQAGKAPAVIVPAAGVVAGSPGGFTPTGAAPPATLAALQGLGGLGQTTKWSSGQHVVLGDLSEAFWNGAAWVQGVSPFTTLLVETMNNPRRYVLVDTQTPANLTALQALGSLGEVTAWSGSKFIDLGDGTKAWWNGGAWAAGTAPAGPAPTVAPKPGTRLTPQGTGPGDEPVGNLVVLRFAKPEDRDIPVDTDLQGNLMHAQWEYGDLTYIVQTGTLEMFTPGGWKVIG